MQQSLFCGNDALAAIEVQDSFGPSLRTYADGANTFPLFMCGDARVVLAELPPASVDFVMTSPPYWGKRQYSNGGIGLEPSPQDFVAHILEITGLLYRILKPAGSFWLNIGDTYQDKSLLGIPWRIAIAMIDRQGWILRNQVVWNKVKGSPDNAADKLRNVHEPLFHFVKTTHYYYDVDAIRSRPMRSKVVNGAIVSATGVSGVRYRRQIELSTALSEREKQYALDALEEMLARVASGKIADFRMIIRNQQRATHSDQESVSGRARELKERGFYFLNYHPNGSKPADVWDILPEDTQKRDGHFAPYPEDLCKTPLLCTCPANGIALDPFCGTGTTMLAAYRIRRRSVGIDISREYLEFAAKRCAAVP